MFIKNKHFTLIELMVALAIFATGVLFILDRRNSSMEVSYQSIQLMKAQGIIDEILADYRLHPFSKEERPLEKDYSPFVVEVQVDEESISIIPEDWRLVPEIINDDEKKKERIILRVSITVKYGSLSSDDPVNEYSISTLIRHIELEKDKDAI